MSYILSNPAWLFGYDVVFKFVIALITLSVSYYSFKMYRLSGRKKSQFFGIGFAFFFLSYLTHGVFSLGSFSNQAVFIMYNFLAVYLHMLLFMLGAATLTYMTFDVKKPRLYTLMILFSLSIVFFSGYNLYLGYIIISIMLFYILFDYLLEYFERKNKKSLMISLAFALLFISHIHFVLSVNHSLFYALGNILELIAYLIILINLVMVFTK